MLVVGFVLNETKLTGNGINLNEGALRVLRYRVTSRLRLEAIHRDYILGLVDDDEDDFDPTDCFIRLIANWGE